MLIDIPLYLLYQDKRSVDEYSKQRADHAQTKGERGEQYLVQILKGTPGKKKILTNCYVPNNDGSTEIDVIMIHETGIYVFESKNHSGWIYGSADQTTWTETFNYFCRYTGTREVEKYKFQNPIMQNKLHVKCLRRFLNGKFVKTVPLHSIIVFGDQCEIKTPIHNTDEYMVLQSFQVENELRMCYYQSPIILSPEEIITLYELIVPMSNVSASIKQQHIEQLQEKHGKVVNRP